MSDERMFSADERQAIRDHARAASASMEAEAVALLKRPALLAEDAAALEQAWDDAIAIRAIAEVLEALERGRA